MAITMVLQLGAGDVRHGHVHVVLLGEDYGRLEDMGLLIRLSGVRKISSVWRPRSSTFDLRVEESDVGSTWRGRGRSFVCGAL